MRGNWDESEPLALANESSHHLAFQQQQQQQQQQSPLPASSADKPSLDNNIPSTTQQQQQEVGAYPLTTPAWANLVVKDEPHDEKNNDSGISPGHYTSDTASPHSDRSINLVGVNGLSPNSASSASPEPRLPLDVNASNLSHDMSYDYSRHHHHHHHMDHLHHHLSSGGSAGIPSPEDTSRDASMSPHEHHDSNDSNNNDETNSRAESAVGDSIEQPIVNSQGKVKTFRCKQCPFVAVTKRDFWTHTSSHIKPEKLLTCPKCPFVTEYKHHLEYHLRNHFGSKPYKCDKCSYTCVNKSMLNSHLKSHSNVYQFRCADCSYATKYCHSLKLHLRKYQHKPAMVLNPDGTPNPLPIVDVYGTRRGPKAKPKKDSTQVQTQNEQTQPMPLQQQQQPQQVQQQQQQQQQQQSPPPSLVNAGLIPTPVATLTPQFQFNAMNGINAFGGFNGAQTLPVPFLGFPYNQLFGGFPMGNPFAAVAAGQNNNDDSNNFEQQATNYSQQAISAKREGSPINGYESPSPSTTHEPVNSCVDAAVDLTEIDKSVAAPLDLSKPETPKQLPRVPVSTNRRKGRAVKLDRRLLENDSDEEMPEQQQQPAPVETNVVMQLKHLRTDMQHMYQYICRLEENLCTRQ